MFSSLECCGVLGGFLPSRDSVWVRVEWLGELVEVCGFDRLVVMLDPFRLHDNHLAINKLFLHSAHNQP